MAGLGEAVAGLNVAASESSETNMHVPHGGGTLLARGVARVPFNNDSTSWAVISPAMTDE